MKIGTDKQLYATDDGRVIINQEGKNGDCISLSISEAKEVYLHLSRIIGEAVQKSEGQRQKRILELKRELAELESQKP